MLLSKKNIIFLIALFTCILSAYASVTQDIENEVQKEMDDQVNIVDMKYIPSGKSYEVIAKNNLIYTHNGVHYSIQSELVDLENDINFSKKKVVEINQMNWNELPFKNSIKIVHGNGKHQIAIFSDPNCRFCKNLEKSLQSLENTTIYIFLIPFLSKDSLIKSKRIWCSIDQTKSWMNWMINNIYPVETMNCITPFEENAILAKKLELNSVPILFFSDGSKISGDASLSQIEEKLKKMNK